jgi:hypothetical protein
MNITYILITFLSFSNVLIPVAWAKPKGCSPSDPTGSNHNSNLCFKYPPFGLKPFGGSFTKSFVHKGYYGPKITPIKPGIDLKPKKRHGYFTGINAKNNNSIIHSSSGKKWKGSAKPQKVRLK